jgi:hypothetical protein
MKKRAAKDERAHGVTRRRKVEKEEWKKKAHVFVVVVEHFTKLLAGYVCVIKDLVVRALSVKILVYAAVDVRERTVNWRGILALQTV